LQTPAILTTLNADFIYSWRRPTSLSRQTIPSPSPTRERYIRITALPRFCLQTMVLGCDVTLHRSTLWSGYCDCALPDFFSHMKESLEFLRLLSSPWLSLLPALLDRDKESELRSVADPYAVPASFSIPPLADRAFLPLTLAPPADGLPEAEFGFRRRGPFSF